MKTLAVDTSTMMATCALLDEDRLLGEFSLNQDMSHSENLVPMIRNMLDNLKFKIEDVDIFGAATGPGSFTGLRIGIATVKTFAHVFDKPVVGVSTLEGLAFNLPCNNGFIVPMIDARRNRVYTGIYKRINGELKNLVEPTIMEVEELLTILRDEYDYVMVNGNGTLVYKDIILDVLKDKVNIAPINLNSCRASSIGELALLKYKEGQRDNYYDLVPNYLRESQAQRELRKRDR